LHIRQKMALERLLDLISVYILFTNSLTERKLEKSVFNRALQVSRLRPGIPKTQLVYSQMQKPIRPKHQPQRD
jgi:hypothetical protein